MHTEADPAGKDTVLGPVGFAFDLDLPDQRELALTEWGTGKVPAKARPVSASSDWIRSPKAHTCNLYSF